ncbi:MAG: glucose-1-phosphate cytidylyltransferase [Rhodobacteraceae bacterium]|nr:MAG: glucose-1-phosphate cytidylyltransferase [Paracoccaceae bacterium]
MKVVILAGGYGTRLSEETHLRPKPMVEIGGKPILWHIMKIFSTHGFNDFIICCGYKGYVIKEYFANYLLHNSDVTIDLSTRSLDLHSHKAEPWKVTLIDTGEATLTGERLKRVHPYLEDQEDFFFTYGDGLSDVNLTKLAKFHKAHGKKASVTVVKPPGRYGAVSMQTCGKVNSFEEKPPGDGGYVNGGFFVLSKDIFDFLPNEDSPWESTPMTNLVEKDELMAFRHDGFWSAMDTLRDKNLLDGLWSSDRAPWKQW